MNQIPPKVLLNCGILEEYWDSDFKDFYGHKEKAVILKEKIKLWNLANPTNPISIDFDEGEKILSNIMLYVDNIESARKNGISLFLWGPNGTGKTLLATSVLKAAIRKGFSAQMTSLGGIIEIYAEGWSNPQKKEVFNERIKDVDFLLIDDVAKEYRAKNNDLVEVAFDNLIRYRSFRRKPFILTTNTDITRLQGTYGKSLTSLLYGKSLSVNVSGSDFRRDIQAKSIKSILRGS